MRPPIGWAAKIPTRSACLFEPGKACRLARDVSAYNGDVNRLFTLLGTYKLANRTSTAFFFSDPKATLARSAAAGDGQRSQIAEQFSGRIGPAKGRDFVDRVVIALLRNRITDCEYLGFEPQEMEPPP